MSSMKVVFGGITVILGLLFESDYEVDEEPIGEDEMEKKGDDKEEDEKGLNN